MRKHIATLTPNKQVDIFGVAEIYYDEEEPIYKYIGEAGNRIERSRTLKNLVARLKTYVFYDIVERYTAYGKVNVPKTLGATLTMKEI